MKDLKKRMILIIMLSIAAILFAQAPQSINFQGALKDANGEPVNDSKYMEFRIYDVLSGGTALWTEQHPTVTIDGGIFSAELGLVTPFPPDMFYAPQLYITYFLGGETTEMSPRRRILSVPYSLLSNEAMLADMADNADHLGGIPPVGYVQQDSLGNVNISGTVSAVSFAGDGSGLSGITGIYDSLYIHSTGPDTMSANSSNAVLTIKNYHSSGNGIMINDAYEGVRVDSASTGISVYSSDIGLYVDNGTEYGAYFVGVDQGIHIHSSINEGINIVNAGSDGYSVFSAGSPSVSYTSSVNNGFEVNGAEGSGVYVGQADQDGIYVYRSGNPTSAISSNSKSGFEVAGAEGDGLYVGYCGVDGVHVKEAADNGLHIEESADFGVRIDSTGNDGIYIRKAGNPSSISPGTSKNGLEIAGTEGDGVYIGHADEYGININDALYGVFVNSAISDGIWIEDVGNNGIYLQGINNYGLVVNDSGEDGVNTWQCSGDGVDANTENVNGEYGVTTPDKMWAGAGYFQTRSGTVGRNTDSVSLEPGDIVCLSGYEENVLGESDIPLINVTKADKNNSDAVIGVVEYKVYIREEIIEYERETRTIKSFRFTEGKAGKADFVSIIIAGPADVKVDSRDIVKTGETLTAGNGLAKKVRTTEVNGITIAENVGILGKALEDSNGKSKIKVYVNCK